MKTLDETIECFSNVMALPLHRVAIVEVPFIETALAHLKLIHARGFDPITENAKQADEIRRLSRSNAALSEELALVKQIGRKHRARIEVLETENRDQGQDDAERIKLLEAANASLSEAVTETSLAKVASVAELERTLAATGARALALESALQRVVDDVLNAERALSVSPNPGRSYCWDSIANAVALLGRHPHTSLSWYTSNADHEREKFLRGLSNCAFDEPFLRSREQYTLNKSDVIRKYAEGKYAAMSWKTRAAEYERHILGCLDAVEKWAVTGMDSVDENRALGLIIVRIRNAARFINKKRAEQVRT